MAGPLDINTLWLLNLHPMVFLVLEMNSLKVDQGYINKILIYLNKENVASLTLMPLLSWSTRHLHRSMILLHCSSDVGKVFFERRIVDFQEEVEEFSLIWLLTSIVLQIVTSNDWRLTVICKTVILRTILARSAFSTYHYHTCVLVSFLRMALIKHVTFVKHYVGAFCFEYPIPTLGAKRKPFHKSRQIINMIGPISIMNISKL